MAMGSMGAGGGPMSEINTTPLIDVMLVLLVVFIMIAPTVTHRIKIDLPEMTVDEPQEPSIVVNLSIDADQNIFWNETAVSNIDELGSLFDKLHNDTPDAEVHVNVDQDVTYERLAAVLGTAQNHKVTKLGFVSKPAEEL